jgi:1-acyl-sn-glycerol-3-phosphate acyltransferase
MISNHISWWDGFWAEYVNLKTFRRKFHFMMLEEQLQKHWYFRYTGGFSVNKKSKSIVESIRYAAEVLSDKENMVLLFPQGKIETMHNQDLLFEKGIDHILKHREDKVQIIFLVNLVDFFSSPKPGVYFYIREYDSGALDTVSIQNSYNVFYRECVEQQKQILS